MNSTLSLPPDNDIDHSMRAVARNLAMGIYPLDKILEFVGVLPSQFQSWKSHPRFTAYLKSETEAWNSAHNTAERTKLKAGIVMEEWMAETYNELRNVKQPLNHRVELGKLVAKIAGMGESSSFTPGGNAGGGGFSLQINIAPGQTTTINARPIVDDVEVVNVEPAPARRTLRRALPVEDVQLPEPVYEPPEVFEDDGYDPFQSPDTLGDFDA